MSLSVQECAEHLTQTLGGFSTDSALTYINDVGEILTTASQWRWLEGRSATLDLVSGQNYEHGYYTAFRHLADEDLDLVIHVGDYPAFNSAT